jgi:6-pyruvoyltetrahydropterin/6-carboxytetrahydropterin synthase
MYRLAIGRAFAARHYLVGGDWGAENEPHAHAYRVEVRLTADKLDRHGYIADLEELEALLAQTVARYEDQLLNGLPEFEGLNPSIEHFSRCFFERLAEGLGGRDLVSMEVRLWETEEAWASYREDFR